MSPKPRKESFKECCHKNKFTKKYKDEKYPLIFFLIVREAVGNYCEVGSDKSQVNDKQIEQQISESEWLFIQGGKMRKGNGQVIKGKEICLFFKYDRAFNPERLKRKTAPKDRSSSNGEQLGNKREDWKRPHMA